MVTTFSSRFEYASQRRNDEHLSEFQGCGGNAAAEFGEVVFVNVADFLDQAVFAQAFEKTRYLVRGAIGHMQTDVFVLESADVELAAQDDVKEVEVVTVKQVESAPTALSVACGARDFLEVAHRRGGSSMAEMKSM
jgi:hypothetical protein